MTLNEMSYHRKSCRSFANLSVDAETFRFFKVENVPTEPGHSYIGSVTL